MLAFGNYPYLAYVLLVCTLLMCHSVMYDLSHFADGRLCFVSHVAGWWLRMELWYQYSLVRHPCRQSRSAMGCSRPRLSHACYMVDAGAPMDPCIAWLVHLHHRSTACIADQLHLPCTCIAGRPGLQKEPGPCILYKSLRHCCWHELGFLELACRFIVLCALVVTQYYIEMV